MIPIDKITADPNFDNLRLDPTDDELQSLAESMKLEGLKVPIEVLPHPTGYHVRAGFRRTRAARYLDWKLIPAIVLPADTPLIDEYWTNIIENSARSTLSTYEIAHAARIMRDKFGIKANEFASRAGYSDSHVSNLLRCIDHLPPEIITEWQQRAPIPLSLYINWASLRPSEAIKAMMVYSGRHPHVTREWKPSTATTNQKKTAIKTTTTIGLSRMQRLRLAVEVASTLNQATRELCMKVIDYCTGARDDVPGVYDGGRVRTGPKPQDHEPPLTAIESESD